ncbi:ammonia monooxygenase [Methylovirgula ligni]|uniref:Ammonia monooxygenase n=1 Tax=Methylovirgula ligni TaxID=569860 RepID=A0A3D9YNQ7_9HYPH|nr:ammonia monooxygenase [Methylovirgula ligni]REF84220.1 hypothetical protein DES32_3067 [Methylovirgula ligni]
MMEKRVEPDLARGVALSTWPLPVQWVVLASATAVIVAALSHFHLPAALLLGSMVGAIFVAAQDARIRVPNLAFILAQGLVGCLVARALKPSIFAEIRADWPLFIVAVASVLFAATFLGWLLARWRVLPGSTALWGSFPGAATVMALMAEAYGADIRLVAIMQYLRVVLVATTASIIAAIWAPGAHAPPPVDWLAPVAPLPFAETLLLAFGGALIAPKLRIPAGSLLVPLVIGATLSDFGVMTIELPPWLLAASYALVGWSIGLRFTRPILVYAMRALPRLILAISALIATCALFGVVLAKLAHVDMLTAYLATSPGGADSVAIIAASTKVDVPFVMALQMARFVIVLLIGPRLARFVAGLSRFTEAGHESKG